MNAGLKGNAQGLWAGTALGAATGALGGGLISLGLLAAGFVAGAATGPGMFIGWPLILGIAGIGGTMGGGIGARIGAGSGAVAGVVAELERRNRADKLEHEILKSPDKQREVIEAYRKDPVVERNDTVREITATTRGGKSFHKFLDWPTFFVAVAICSVVSMGLFGAAFALGGGLGGGIVASGLGALGMTSLPATLAIGAGAGAGMGAAFGIAYPPIFATLTKHTGDLLSGKMVRGKSNFNHIKSVAEIEQEAAQNRIISESTASAKQHVFSLNDAADQQVNGAVLDGRVTAPTHQVAV